MTTALRALLAPEFLIVVVPCLIVIAATLLAEAVSRRKSPFEPPADVRAWRDENWPGGAA